jgi:hypothetical protein
MSAPRPARSWAASPEMVRTVGRIPVRLKFGQPLTFPKDVT